MISFIFRLSLRQLTFRKSTLLLLGLAVLPVLIGLALNLSNPEDLVEQTASQLLANLLVTTVLPLTALLLGTSVLGDDLEDGTAIYLLTKPLPRWQILAPKVAAAWLLTMALCVTSTLVSGVVALGEIDSIVYGFVVGVALASLAYAAVFVFLSVLTTRALIAGLIYVFIWEGALSGIFNGLRYLSIRHYALGIADSVGDIDPKVFDAYVGGFTAVVMLVIVTTVALYCANLRLEQSEIREAN